MYLEIRKADERLFSERYFLPREFDDAVVGGVRAYLLYVIAVFSFIYTMKKLQSNSIFLGICVIYCRFLQTFMT